MRLLIILEFSKTFNSQRSSLSSKWSYHVPGSNCSNSWKSKTICFLLFSLGILILCGLSKVTHRLFRYLFIFILFRFGFCSKFFNHVFSTKIHHYWRSKINNIDLLITSFLHLRSFFRNHANFLRNHYLFEFCFYSNLSFRRNLSVFLRSLCVFRSSLSVSLWFKRHFIMFYVT